MQQQRERNKLSLKKAKRNQNTVERLLSTVVPLTLERSNHQGRAEQMKDPAVIYTKQLKYLARQLSTVNPYP